MEFKPIETAPIGANASDQILCRFLYRYGKPHYVYFVCYPNGIGTHADGYAAPEEWCELPV